MGQWRSGREHLPLRRKVESPAGLFAGIALGPIDPQSPDWFGRILATIAILCGMIILATLAAEVAP